MKSIILIAPPAAGKGTQAKVISKMYNIPTISTGALLRKEIDEEGPFHDEIVNEMKLGHLIKDEITIKLLLDRMKEKDCELGYILDGFPRNLKQAKVYDEILASKGKNIDYVFVLDAPYEMLEDRIEGRLSCPGCGHIYNSRFEDHRPKNEGICDDCNSSLVKREDDNSETYNKRFKTYERITKPLIAFYENKKILHHINSSINKDVTFKQIKNILDGGSNEH